MNQLTCKKIYGGISILLCLLLLAGCIVPEATEGFGGVQKMQAGQSCISGDIQSQINVPPSLEFHRENKDSTIIADANAKIEWPNVQSLAQHRISAAAFSQEQVDAALQYLFQGKTIYEQENFSQTIEELEDRLVLIEKDIANSDNQDYVAELKEEKKRIEEILADPSATQEPKQSDGQLKLSTDYLGQNSLYTTSLNVYAKDENSKHLHTFDLYANIDFSSYQEKDFSYTSDTLYTVGATMQYMSMSDYYQSVSDAESSPPLTTFTAEQAESKALDFLKTIGAEVSLEKIQLMKNLDKVNSSKKSPLGDYSYHLQFNRKIGPTHTLYCEGSYGSNSFNYNYNSYDSDNISSTILEPDFSSYSLWNYEQINLLIDESGILRFEWTSPVSIVESIPQTQSLLPFSDISEIYQKMLFVKYGNYLKIYEDISHLYLHTDSVKLGYFRVSDERSPFTGTMVPAWGFYGSVQYDTNSSGNKISYPQNNSPLLIINAIDGSIIQQ